MQNERPDPLGSLIELIELVQYVIKYIDSQIVDGLLGDSDESISKD